MHIGPQVIGDIQGDDLPPGTFEKVVEFAIGYVEFVNYDVITAVRS